MKHPIHPMLIVFPVSLLTLTFASDAAFLLTARAFWAEASFWLATAGLVMGLVAAAAGMVDFFSMPEVRRHIIGWSHFLAGTMALALAGSNVQYRWEDPAAVVWPVGIALSATMAAVVGLAGWLGGTLTFKHGIGSYGPEYRGEGHERSGSEA